MKISQLRMAVLLGLGFAFLLGVGCTQEAAEPEPPVVENPAAPIQAGSLAEPKPTPAPASAAPTGGATGKPANSPAAPATGMPEVLLSEQHKAKCKIFVGDAMPEMTLPDLKGQPTALSSLYGRRATVVFFFDPSPASQAELADMGPDVASPTADRGVQVVGVAVHESPDAAGQLATQAGAHFPILVDTTGGAFAQVGIDMLPRTYLLGPTGKILWFDIEYSRTTRRQLQRALDAVLGEKQR